MSSFSLEVVTSHHIDKYGCVTSSQSIYCFCFHLLPLSLFFIQTKMSQWQQTLSFLLKGWLLKDFSEHFLHMSCFSVFHQAARGAKRASKIIHTKLSAARTALKLTGQMKGLVYIGFISVTSFSVKSFKWLFSVFCFVLFFCFAKALSIYSSLVCTYNEFRPRILFPRLDFYLCTCCWSPKKKSPLLRVFITGALYESKENGGRK